MGIMMKILPIFLVVMFLSGAIVFSYMAWATFRGRDDQFNLFNKKPLGPNNPLMGDGDQSFSNMNQQKTKGKHGFSPFDANEGLLPGLDSVDEQNLVGVDLKVTIDRLKMKIISKLRRHILDGAKVKGHLNQYRVNFNKLKVKSKVDRETILCRIKKLKIDILNENSSPLFRGKIFPKEPIFNTFSSNDGSRDDEKSSSYYNSNNDPIYRSCAVVPNSAALDGAKHGVDIDSHDFILRFNNAPSAGFEEDVGALTSMRIVNSQVVTKPRFAFPYAFYGKSSNENGDFENTNDSQANQILESLWSGSRKYLIWDPCNYSSTVEQWYSKPDFPFFEKYFNLTSERPEDRNRFYVLDCRVIWKLWELLQEFTFARIYGNPPTSGFIGIVLALQKCERVFVYEYIPSIRETEKCHYYGQANDTNPACTYGSWHPVSAEKLFFLGITDGTDKQIFLDGILTIPGVSQFPNC